MRETSVELTIKQRNRVQVCAFQAIYKALRNDGTTSEERFVTAICQTSDDTFATIAKNNPSLIRKWLKKYSRSKNETKHTKQNQTVVALSNSPTP